MILINANYNEQKIFHGNQNKTNFRIHFSSLEPYLRCKIIKSKFEMCFYIIKKQFLPLIC